MASQVTPKKNTAFTCFISLTSQADTKLFQVNPTLAAGDVKVSVDGGTFNNITTLPVVTPAGGRGVQVDLSAAEMNGDNIQVQFVDAAGAEWCDALLEIQTTAGQIDNLVLVQTATNLTNNTPTAGTITTLSQLTAVIPDSVPADGTRPSIQQALYMLTQFLFEGSVSGLTYTARKPDGTTALFTLTLNDAVSPTSITRAT